MRTIHNTLTSLGILATAIFVQLTACSNPAEDCTQNLESCESSGAGTPQPSAECAKSPKDEPGVIKDACGFFVSVAGDDANAGTADKPFKTLGKAADAAKAAKARVYACADGTYAERVEVPAGVSIFGGFSCMSGTWNYDAPTGATIEPTAPGPDDVQATLRVAGNGTTQLEDLVVRAPDAVFPGGSSIVVIVDGATVDFVRTHVFSGNGASGATGATPTDDIGPQNPDDPAVRGNNGQNACMGGSGGNPGGAAKMNGLCSKSVGGKGGTGWDLIDGDKGDDGMPMVSGFGAGGTGEGPLQCSPGNDGFNGARGDDGTGAIVDGTLDATKGYVGASGMPGTKGTVGQGGGGGGGAKGKTVCHGASGGSGGAGGCAGNGALGGMAGGSSIGIVHLGGTVRFDTTTITVGDGGEGGAGGEGQFGAPGGTGGTGGAGFSGTSKACNGGSGGQGGNGGRGGGGRGGHSVGIAHKGASSPDTTGVMIMLSTAGMGGLGSGADGTGVMGIPTTVHAFP